MASPDTVDAAGERPGFKSSFYSRGDRLARPGPGASLTVLSSVLEAGASALAFHGVKRFRGGCLYRSVVYTIEE